MHTVLIAAAFVVMVLSPCFVAMFSSTAAE